MYRALLKLYPARFREEYGGPLEQQFRDEYREARTRRGRFMLLLQTLVDFCVSLPAQGIRELRQDIRHSLRVHSQSPLATGFAVAALALAIGVTTGIFSIVNAVLIRSLPFRAPEHIVQLWFFPRGAGESPAAFHSWRAQSTYLQNAAVYAIAEMNLGSGSHAVRVKAAETSFNFFSMLGSEPVVGRGFAPGEDVAGRNTVAVISYSLWQQMFGGDPRAIGATIRLNGIPLTVIGVAHPQFDYPSKAAVWTPTVFAWEQIPKTGVTFWETIGRLKDGIGRAQASSMYEAEVSQLDPAASGRDELNRPRLVPMQDHLAGRMRQASIVLMAGVAFVMLIAAANIANLLLSRIAERRKELVVRAALGASRGRLCQQLATESIVLALVAAAAGLPVAYWTSKLASFAYPANLVSQQYSIVDWRVMAFAVAAAALASLVFGVLPALVASRLQPAGGLIRSQMPASPRGAAHFRRVLIGFQVSLTVVLLAGSVAMGRTFLKVVETDLGFRKDHLVTMSVSLAGTRHDTGDLTRRYYSEALTRLRDVPGVESAAGVEYLPLATTAFPGVRFHLDKPENAQFAAVIPVTPDYFRTMGTEILHGREFVASDRKGTESVAILNEEFARSLGQPSTLMSKQLHSIHSGLAVTVVGIVRTARYSPEYKGGPQVFLSHEQRTPKFLTFVARVNGRAKDYLAQCRDALRSVDQQIPVFNVSTMEERFTEALARPRFYTLSLLFFGGFALFLALTGIYGMASYAAAQRRHEIGVRIALGASPNSVRRLLVRQGLLPVAAGAVAGVLGAFSLGRSLQHLITDAETVEATTCIAAALLLALVAAAAIWRATRRLADGEPLEALRAD